MNFDAALGQVLLHEGEWSDDAVDPGGKTRYGITESVAREVGYRGDMRMLPMDLIRRIYKDRYWEAMCCDDLPDSVRLAVFDTAVNSGVAQTTRWLQRAVGVAADGIIGPVTLKAISAHNADNLCRELLAQRLRLLTGLPSWSEFGKGWVRRVCDLLEA